MNRVAQGDSIQGQKPKQAARLRCTKVLGATVMEPVFSPVLGRDWTSCSTVQQVKATTSFTYNCAHQQVMRHRTARRSPLQLLQLGRAQEGSNRPVAAHGVALHARWGSSEPIGRWALPEVLRIPHSTDPRRPPHSHPSFLPHPFSCFCLVRALAPSASSAWKQQELVHSRSLFPTNVPFFGFQLPNLWCGCCIRC